MPLTCIGRALRELDTPALCVDLAALESNLATVSSIVRDSGKGWRPHQKCPKTPAVAWKMLRAGAFGVTVAKVSEAEVLSAAGILDILIAHMPVGPGRVERIAGLCGDATPVVAFDHFAQAEPLAAACRRRGVVCRAIVDVNVGLNRTGVRPGRDALELAQAIDRLEGLKLVGVMGYEGHLMPVADPAEKIPRVQSALQSLELARDQFREAGLCCEIVSAGGTGTLNAAAHCPAITEWQAGGGVFGDPFYTDNCGQTGLRPSLSILATVVSRPNLDRAVLDAGRKTYANDPCPARLSGLPDAKVIMLSAEHSTLELGPESQALRIGDQVEILVGYGDFTTMLHDEMHAIRNGHVEAVWPLWGRGKLQ